LSYEHGITELMLI